MLKRLVLFLFIFLYVATHDAVVPTLAQSESEVEKSGKDGKDDDGDSGGGDSGGGSDNSGSGSDNSGGGSDNSGSGSDHDDHESGSGDSGDNSGPGQSGDNSGDGSSGSDNSGSDNSGNHGGDDSGGGDSGNGGNDNSGGNDGNSGNGGNDGNSGNGGNNSGNGNSNNDDSSDDNSGSGNGGDDNSGNGNSGKDDKPKDEAEDNSGKDDYKEDDRHYYVGSVSANDGSSVLTGGTKLESTSPWLEILDTGMLFEAYGLWKDEDTFVADEINVLAGEDWAYVRAPGVLLGEGDEQIEAWTRGETIETARGVSKEVGQDSVRVVAYFDGTQVRGLPKALTPPLPNQPNGWAEFTGHFDGDGVVWEASRPFP